MKTINSINSKINSINNEIDSLTIERRTLSNKRDEVSKNRRDEIIFKIETLKDEKSKLRNELYEVERHNEKIKFGIGCGITGLLFILFIVGCVIITKYKYEVGLYGLTTEHDIISIINGDSTVISVDLYNHLFMMNVVGSLSMLIGILGTLVSGIWTMIWGLNNNVI